MKGYSYTLIILFLGSCSMSSREYYYLKSPDQQQVLTFVSVHHVFEPEKESKEMQSGIYVYLGYYNEGDNLPKEYLKIKYTDFSSLGIFFGDTITIGYNYIQENTFQKDTKIRIYYDTGSGELIKAENKYRSQTGSSKTAYVLDEIFDQRQEK